MKTLENILKIETEYSIFYNFSSHILVQAKDSQQLNNEIYLYLLDPNMLSTKIVSWQMNNQKNTLLFSMENARHKRTHI